MTKDVYPKYYYYELREFYFLKNTILNLIITNYIRKQKLKKQYDILVIANNINDFEYFVKYVNQVIKDLTINTLEEYLSKYENKTYHLTKKDLDDLKKIKIIKMDDDYNKYNNEYDFVILNSITKRNLKKLIIDKTYHLKDNNPFFLQNYIYLLYYDDNFDKIYNEVFGNFYYLNGKLRTRSYINTQS